MVRPTTPYEGHAMTDLSTLTPRMAFGRLHQLSLEHLYGAR